MDEEQLTNSLQAPSSYTDASENSCERSGNQLKLQTKLLDSMSILTLFMGEVSTSSEMLPQ